MFINSIILAISSSIDSLGIGVTYGIRNTKISYIGKVILFVISFITSIVAIWFGNIIKNIFPEFLTKLIGSIILIFMGIFIFIQALSNKKTNSLKNKCNTEEKIYSFFIKFLGITVKIIKNPISSDFDNSNLIDAKEAFFLGLALSLDAFCIGIGSSIIGIHASIFPLLVSSFQMVFLSIGNKIGNNLTTLTNIPNNIWSIISSLILILIGLIKLFL